MKRVNRTLDEEGSFVVGPVRPLEEDLAAEILVVVISGCAEIAGRGGRRGGSDSIHAGNVGGLRRAGIVGAADAIIISSIFDQATIDCRAGIGSQGEHLGEVGAIGGAFDDVTAFVR